MYVTPHVCLYATPHVCHTTCMSHQIKVKLYMCTSVLVGPILIHIPIPRF